MVVDSPGLAAKAGEGRIKTRLAGYSSVSPGGHPGTLAETGGVIRPTRPMEVTMRLGKEQAAGYVEDTESGVTEQVPAPAVAEVADPLPVAAEQEPVALPR